MTYPIKHSINISRVLGKGVVSLNGDGIHNIILQRQGISNTFHGGLHNEAGSYVHIELNEFNNSSTAIELSLYKKPSMSGRSEIVRFHSTTESPGKRTHGSTATEYPLASAVEYIQTSLGTKATIADIRMAYMFDGATRSDAILSPLVYEAYSDTIRSTAENYCVVYFKEGKFDQPGLDMDAAAGFYRKFVEDALKKGFHSCDRDKGDDYCKKRLAWLAGAFILEDASKRLTPINRVGILKSNMGW